MQHFRQHLSNTNGTEYIADFRTGEQMQDMGRKMEWVVRVMVKHVKSLSGPKTSRGVYVEVLPVQVEVMPDGTLGTMFSFMLYDEGKKQGERAMVAYAERRNDKLTRTVAEFIDPKLPVVGEAWWTNVNAARLHFAK
jgi:hypothetical protein